MFFFPEINSVKNNRLLQNEKQELERAFDFNSADSLKKERLNQCEKAGSRPDTLTLDGVFVSRWM